MTYCFICGAKIEDSPLPVLYTAEYRFIEIDGKHFRLLFISCPDHPVSVYRQKAKELLDKPLSEFGLELWHLK